jgi:hypothetical protein
MTESLEKVGKSPGASSTPPSKIDERSASTVATKLKKEND